MKRHFSLLYPIFSYYLLTSVFMFWRVESFVKDIFVAPLYFIFPTGVGLLLFTQHGVHRRLAGSIGAASVVLTGTFVGIVAITLLYQDLERGQHLSSWFSYLYPILLALSLIGYYRARSIFDVDKGTLVSTARALAWIVPVALLSYYFLFLKFSSFPLRDIFQETHFIKGAHELARFQILNPFITASYLSVIQVHLGLLNHFYGYDLVNSQWILPAYAYFFHLGCYAVFFSTFIREVSAVRLALALATILGTAFFIENMILLESMLLVFFSIMVRLNSGSAQLEKSLSTSFWLLLLFVIYYVYFNYLFADHPVFSGIPSPYSGLWVIGLLVFYLANQLRMSASTNLFFLMFVAISMFAMHRAILLFFPIILFLYLVYTAVFSRKILDRTALRFSLIRVVFFSFTLIAATMLLADYVLTASQEGYQNWTSGIAFRIGEILLRTPSMVGSGTGFNHSLVEYLRISPPLMLFIVFIFLLLYVAYPRFSRTLLGNVRNLNIDSTNHARIDCLNQVTFFVLTIPILVLLVLSTIPYVYRGAFFPSILTIGLVACLFEFIRKAYLHVSPVRAPRLWILLISVGAVLSYFFIYGFSGGTIENENPYLKALFPLPQLGILFLILLSAAVYFGRSSRTVAIITVAVSIVIVVVMDTFNFRTMFYDKAYGPRMPESAIISHYTKQELEMGQMLRALPAKSLLVSDPYTLSILRATTGLNSVYSFANINLVTAPQLYQETFQFISRIGEVDEKKARDQLYWLADAIRTKTAAEGFYIWNKMHDGSQRDLMSADQMYDYFIWVINAKTFQWAEGIDTYYPDDTPLDSQFLAHLERYFDILINLDNRVIAFKLKRSVVPFTFPPRSCDSDCTY